MAGSGWAHGRLPAPSPHPAVPLPPSQGASAELCPSVALFSPANRISVLFWVSCLPCPLCFCSETCCFFKAVQQQAFDNLLVLSQVYIKAQQWSRISYSGCGTDFSFQRCGWFAIFFKHTYDLHRTALQKVKSCIVVQFVSQNSIPGHRKHVLCHMWTGGKKKLGERNQFIPDIYLCWIYTLIPEKMFVCHKWILLLEHGRCYSSTVCFQLQLEN